MGLDDRTQLLAIKKCNDPIMKSEDLIVSLSKIQKSKMNLTLINNILKTSRHLDLNRVVQTTISFLLLLLLLPFPSTFPSISSLTYMMMSSFLPLSLNPPFTHKTLTTFLSKSSLSTKPFICFSSQTNPPNFDHREEIRWLREEQRWLREEQRWLREEQRWLRDRESLLREVSDLKLQIQTLENQNLTQGASVTDTIANVAGLLQVLKEKNLIAESGSSGKPLVRVLGAEKEKKKEESVKKRKELRKGSEGEDVRSMQVCLQSAFLV